ncbi:MULTISPECIES: transposase [unclassified Kitasatospora]
MSGFVTIQAQGEPRAVPAPRKYPDELRERAVREVRSTGRPVAHVARDLGIHKEALRSWVPPVMAERRGSRAATGTSSSPGSPRRAECPSPPRL